MTSNNYIENLEKMYLSVNNSAGNCSDEHAKILNKWDSLSEQDKLDFFYAVVFRISDAELNLQTSYRHILYDVFNFPLSSYGMGVNCGFLDLHHAIYSNQELESLLIKFCEEFSLDPKLVNQFSFFNTTQNKSA